MTASEGVATFYGLTLTTAYSDYSLVIYASGLTDAVTTPIAVSPLAASQLVVTEEPATSVTAGSRVGLEAAIEDMYGNVETGDNGDVVTLVLATNPKRNHTRRHARRDCRPGCGVIFRAHPHRGRRRLYAWTFDR